MISRNQVTLTSVTKEQLRRLLPTPKPPTKFSCLAVAHLAASVIFLSKDPTVKACGYFYFPSWRALGLVEKDIVHVLFGRDLRALTKRLFLRRSGKIQEPFLSDT